MHCHLGDFGEYAAIRAELSALEKISSRESARLIPLHAAQSLESWLPETWSRCPRDAGPDSPSSLTPGSTTSRTPPTGAHDRPAGPPTERHRLQHRRSSWTGCGFPNDFHPAAPMPAKPWPHDCANSPGVTPRADPRVRDSGNDVAIQRLRARLRKHPCHGCDDRNFTRAGPSARGRLQRGERQSCPQGGGSHQHHRAAVRSDLRGPGRTGLPAGQRRRPRGDRRWQMLGHLYTDRSLVIAECLRTGLGTT